MPFSVTRDLWLVLKARDEGTRAMRSFSRDIRMVGDSVRLANLNAAKSAALNHLAQQRLTGATKAQLLVTQKHIQGLDQQIHGMRVARAAMEEHRFSAQRLSAGLGGVAAAAGAMGTGLLLAGGIGSAGLKHLIDTAIEYQKQSNLTRTQVDKFNVSLREIEDIGIRVGRSIGVPFEQLQPALFDIFSSMEIGAKDAERLLATFAKAAVAGQTDIQSASRATIGILNAFQLPLSSVNHLMDLQFQLVQEGVGTYDEWAQRIGLVTPSAARAGQSVETMLAALAATTRMGISAARSGTSVARAFDAMSNPKTVKALKALGVNALDAKGSFRPLIDVLGEFREKLMAMPKAERIAKLLEVFKGAGGTIEARRFLQNMLLTPGNLELFKSIFDEMSKTSGSFEQAYAIMADSAATKSQQLANKWETVKIAAGEALIPTFLKVVEALGKVFDWFNRLTPGQQEFIVKVLAVGAALSIALGLFLLIVGGIAAFAAAIAVAGAGLGIFIGVLAALALGFGILVAAILIAWNKSEGFRNIVKNLGKTIVDFYKNEVVPAAQAIGAAWNKYVVPPLLELKRVIETWVVPIFQELSEIMKGEAVGAAIEIGNTIKDILIVSFKEIGAIIQNIVIPAIMKLVEFYQDHNVIIKQIIGWLAEFFKWAAKIAVILGVVLVAAITPLLVGFGLLIAAFMLVAAAVVFIVEAAKKIISWFGADGPVVAALKVVGAFFVSIWNGIVAFLSPIIAKIVAIVMTGVNFIRGIWETFWSMFGGLIKAGWDLAVAIFQLGILLVVNVVRIGFNMIISIWNTIKSNAINIWNGIITFFKIIFDLWISGFRSVWTNIKNLVVGIWRGLVGTANQHFGGLFSTIRGWLDKAFGAVKTVLTNIRDFFAGAGSWLVNAGKNLLQGLIDGITSKISAVTDKIRSVTKTIRDHLPFSPAKIGPLSGRGSPQIAGQKIVQMLSSGMQSRNRLIKKASEQVAESARTRVNGMLGSGSSGGRSVNQTFNVTTQEINPRKHSAELGWLLAGRI